MTTESEWHVEYDEGKNRDQLLQKCSSLPTFKAVIRCSWSSKNIHLDPSSGLPKAPHTLYLFLEWPALLAIITPSSLAALWICDDDDDDDMLFEQGGTLLTVTATSTWQGVAKRERKLWTKRGNCKYNGAINALEGMTKARDWDIKDEPFVCPPNYQSYLSPLSSTIASKLSVIWDLKLPIIPLRPAFFTCTWVEWLHQSTVRHNTRQWWSSRWLSLASLPVLPFKWQRYAVYLCILLLSVV